MELDLVSQVLLVVISLMLIRDVVANFLHNRERADMMNKLMARSLTEYTKSTLDLTRAQRGELTADEEEDAFHEKLRKDRMPV